MSLDQVEIETRLCNCFQTVFPSLEESETRVASVASLPEWDSLATVTMISLVEEEFGIRVPEDEMELFVSYKAICDLIGKKLETA